MSVVKRPPEEVNGSQPTKKVMLEPSIGPVSTLEEMDIQVLRFQYQKLKQGVELRDREAVDLKKRISQLEKRQTQDDAVLNVINRYWNQLNEDIRILLQRFDTDTSDEAEENNENGDASSILTQLATWDKDELDEKLATKVQVSTRAVTKIIQAFDRLRQHSEDISQTLKQKMEEELTDLPNKALNEANIELGMENRRIQDLNTSLHEKFHGTSLKMKKLQDQLFGEQMKSDELQNQVDDLNWEISKLTAKNDALINSVQDLTEKYKRLQQLYGACGSSGGDPKVQDLAHRKVELSEREVANLQEDIEELRMLAGNRLAELDQLQQTHKETSRELEELRMDIRQLPENIIVKTTEFRCLQSKFSVAYNDNQQLRASLEDTKQNLCTMRKDHLQQIETLQNEELCARNKLNADMINLEGMLAQVRKDYETLHGEFKQNLVVNEQIGPLGREMRQLVTSLQNHNKQLKKDAARFRFKYNEMCGENMKLINKKSELQAKIAAATEDKAPHSAASTTSYSEAEFKMSEKEETTDEKTKRSNFKDRLKPESENLNLKELRLQLTKVQNEGKEIKFLLDMYKGASTEHRSMKQLAASERKIKAEVQELKETLAELRNDSKVGDSKTHSTDEVVSQQQRIKSLEDQVHALLRQVTTQKQEEESLISGMDATGQAFEDMQEQNARLIKHLREKDDANFKLVSDMIKFKQSQSCLKEERNFLQDQVSNISEQVEAKDEMAVKLQEKDKLLWNTIASLEKEAALRQQSMELHRRKAVESAQACADFKLHLEKYRSQVNNVQEKVAEKCSTLEGEACKTKKLEEEIALLKRKLERLNKTEIAANNDEVMMEEIREYKETLTCPSCKMKRKDAVLTKCFHVFCFDCLRTRYETRQRKCPKCNANFGANDYHRLHLS